MLNIVKLLDDDEKTREFSSCFFQKERKGVARLLGTVRYDMCVNTIGSPGPRRIVPKFVQEPPCCTVGINAKVSRELQRKKENAKNTLNC